VTLTSTIWCLLRLHQLSDPLHSHHPLYPLHLPNVLHMTHSHHTLCHYIHINFDISYIRISFDVCNIHTRCIYHIHITFDVRYIRMLNFNMYLVMYIKQYTHFQENI